MYKIYAANINLKNNLIGASGLKELKDSYVSFMSKKKRYVS